jgi:hypothetical protein
VQLLEQTQTVEAQSGLMLPGGRRRTPGGVVFRLVREQTTPAERRHLWPWTKNPKPKTAPNRSDAD